MHHLIRLVDRLVAVLATSALVVATSMILINVLNRYVVLGWLRSSSEDSNLGAWAYELSDQILSPISATADEVPGLLLIWIAFLGAYLAYRQGGHISFDMIVDALPSPIRRLLITATESTIMAFLIVLLVQSVRMIMVDGETEIETAEIAQGWFMLIIPLSAGLMVFALLIDIYERWIERRLNQRIET